MSHIEPDEEQFHDDLQEAVADAIQKVLNARGGGLIEGFIGMLEYMTPDGQHGFGLFNGTNQLHTRTLGMAQYLHAWNLEIQRLDFHEVLRDMGDDGDQYNE